MRIAFIGITSKCNLSCRHCYLTKGQKNITVEKDKAVSLLETLASCGFVKLVYTHGEIFLHQDWLEILKAGKELGFIQNVLTNGMLITKEIAEELGKLEISNIYLSLDSSVPEKHNCHRNSEEAFQGMKKAVSLLIECAKTSSIGLITVIEESTIEELIPLYNTALQLGVKEHAFLTYHNGVTPSSDFFSRLTVEFEKLLIYAQGKDCTVVLHEPLVTSKLKHLYSKIDICGAGSEFLSIFPNGNVTPCNFIDDDLGNIYRDDFLAIVGSTRSWIDNVKNKALDECNSCTIFNDCKGGCLAYRWSNGSRCYYECI